MHVKHVALLKLRHAALFLIMQLALGLIMLGVQLALVRLPLIISLSPKYIRVVQYTRTESGRRFGEDDPSSGSPGRGVCGSKVTESCYLKEGSRSRLVHDEPSCEKSTRILEMSGGEGL